MNPWRGLKNIPHNVWILAVTTLINRSGTMVIPFLALYMTKSLGFSTGSAGFVLTFYGLGGLVIAPFAGKLSDKIGALNLMKISLGLSGIMLFIYAFITNYYLILVYTFLWSLISESFRPANLSILSSEAEPGKQKLAFALNRLAVNLGMSIGPVIGGILSTINFHLLFYVDGITSILAAIYLAASRFDIKNRNEVNPENKIDEVDSNKSNIHRGNILADKRFILFLILILPVPIVFFQIFGAIPIYLVNTLGYKGTVFGLIMAVNTVMIIFIEVPLNNVLSNWDDGKSIALGALLCGIGFGAMALSGNILFIIFTVVIWTFGEMVFFPSVTSYVTSISPNKRRGEYMGYFQMTFSFSLVIGPWLGTEVLENFGHVILWGASFIICMITFLLFLKRKPDNSL